MMPPSSGSLAAADDHALHDRRNRRQPHAELQRILPPPIDLVPRGIDDFAFAQRQAKEIGPRMQIMNSRPLPVRR